MTPIEVIDEESARYSRAEMIWTTSSYTLMFHRMVDGAFVATVLELPDCQVTADTLHQAAFLIEVAAYAWIAEALRAGGTVPRPFSAEERCVVERVARMCSLRQSRAAPRLPE